MLTHHRTHTCITCAHPHKHIICERRTHVQYAHTRLHTHLHTHTHTYNTYTYTHV